MDDKPIVLIIDDNVDSAKDYKEDAEVAINVHVIILHPPPDLSTLAAFVIANKTSAVILDEVLQHRSDASYMGVDAYHYLLKVCPGLPIIIFTEFPPGPELKDFPTGLLIRKHDLSSEDIKGKHFNDLFRKIESYNQEQGEINKRRNMLREKANFSVGKGITRDLVEYLVRLHFELEETIELIVWFGKEGDSEIHLIEVNRTALPVESVQPFRFAPSEDIPFSMSISDVTPKDWERIKNGRISLPQNWDLETAQTFEREPH
jgi:hypothetical protein